MRTTPLIGKKPWFGPRGWGGWGWEPISWEGWVSSLSVLIVAFWPMQTGDGVMKARPAAVCALLLVLCLMKGTSPGGPKRKAEYERLRLFPGGRAEQRWRRQNTPDEAVVQETAQRLRAARRR